MSLAPFLRIKLIYVSVPAMITAVWAIENAGYADPQDAAGLEAEYLYEQHRTELGILRFQLQCLTGEITAVECQEKIGDWMEREYPRLAAQADRANILDSIKPLDTPTDTPLRKPPACPEEAELQQAEAEVAAALAPIRQASGTPFEAQEKIDQWAHTEAGAAMIEKQERLRAEVNSIQWKNLTSVELEEPANATPAQLEALDAEEKIIGRWLALKMSVPGGDLLRLQELVDRESAFFEPLRNDLAKARDAVRLEGMRRRIAELESITASGPPR